MLPLPGGENWGGGSKVKIMPVRSIVLVIKDNTMTVRYIAFAVFLIFLTAGLVSGDFFETWRNGATL